MSVAEDSADVHAAALVRAARERLPGVEFYGLTGPRLRELGVETVFDFASHAAMLAGVLGVLRRAYRAVQAVERSWRQRRPDLVVLIDSPELHLRLARKARQLGIPVLYYIAPQTWASREYRNRQIVRDIDRLACILPFEEEYFRGIKGSRERGIEVGIQGLRDSGIKGFRAEYVGHPLFETLRQERPIAETVEFLRARAGGRPIVAILPGSRRHVIGTMLPMQLEVIRRMRAAGQNVYAAISCVSEERREQIREILAKHGEISASNVGHGGPALQPFARASGSDPAGAEPGRYTARQSGALCSPAGTEPGRYAAGQSGALCSPAGTEPGRNSDADIDIVIADNASLLTAADFVLVASGTATLHVAHYRKPMIVMYDAGRLLHWPYRLLGRYVIKTPHLSLVNVLAGARVVPEFMPFIRDLAPIVTVAGQLLTDKAWRELMTHQLDELVRPLEESQASFRVCEIMSELLAARCGA